MSLTVISALLLALIIYISIGLVVGRKTKVVADLLPMSDSKQACVINSREFSSSTVATTISLATVIMAFFELAGYLGVWLFWAVITTSMGLFLVRLFAKRIWQRISTYDHKPTLHEFLGSEFDSRLVSHVGAICTSLGFLGAFAVELTVGSKFFAALVPNFPAWILIVGLSLVAFFYTAVGGFRAVIIADRIQMSSIWLLVISLPLFYIWYVFTHNGLSEAVSRIPPGILSFSYKQGLTPFLLGIFVINVPTFISDMSVWQRIAGTQKDETVTGGLWTSVLSATSTWGVLALLACFVFMIVKPVAGVNPLITLLHMIGTTTGLLTVIVLFVTVLGLYGAMLSTASTQLIAVSHTLYVDVFSSFVPDSLKKRLDSKRELNSSRAILVIAAVVATIVVQWLSRAGFSIADLVFAVYGAQLGLCPLVISALLMDKKQLKRLSLAATIAVSAGFLTGWGSAIYGRFTGNTNLVFLAPVFSLVASSVLLSFGIVCQKVRSWPHSMDWILIHSVVKARRNGLYRLVPASKPMQLVCLKDKCAKCCKVIGTPVVTPEEANEIGYCSIMKDRDAMFIRSDYCVCCLLKDGLCSIYSHRPRGCREYPWYNIFGKLYYDAGCPGVKYEKDERPDIDEIQPFENFFPNTPRYIIWFIKKVCVSNYKTADEK